MLKNTIMLILVALINLACNQSQPAKKQEQVSFTKLSESEMKLKEALPEAITKENHAWVMDAILGKPKREINLIGILVYDGVNDLDLMGPRYVLGQVGAKVQLIALKPGTIKTVMGVEVVPNTVIDSVNRLDILVIPGGFKGTVQAAYNEKLLQWIRDIDKTSIYTTAVCTGVWVLGATGLLDGKRATTNWYKAEEMLKKYGVTFSNERFTQDGKYWTSAGVTAGMDMALAIVTDTWGEKYAQGIMLDMEYDPAPPIVGGTPEKTNGLVQWMINSLYDAGVNPLIDSLEELKTKH